MKPAKRKQILDVTEQLFNRFGIKRTGIDEIAQLANVAKGTIYNYFESKDGLFRELVKEKISNFEVFLNTNVAAVNDPIEKVKSVLVEHLNIVLKNPFLSDKLLYGQYDDKIKAALENLNDTTRTVITGFMSNGNKALKRMRNKKAAVNAMLYTMRGMVEKIRTDWQSESIENLEKEIDYLVNALLKPVLAEK